jgi:hypothetical protein
MRPLRAKAIWLRNKSPEIPISNKSHNGALAQLVEQRTFNPFVVGSIPARPTNIQAACSDASRFYLSKICYNIKQLSNIILIFDGF